MDNMVTIIGLWSKLFFWLLVLFWDFMVYEFHYLIAGDMVSSKSLQRYIRHISPQYKPKPTPTLCARQVSFLYQKSRVQSTIYFLCGHSLIKLNHVTLMFLCSLFYASSSTYSSMFNMVCINAKFFNKSYSKLSFLPTSTDVVTDLLHI